MIVWIHLFHLTAGTSPFCVISLLYISNFVHQSFLFPWLLICYFISIINNCIFFFNLLSYFAFFLCISLHPFFLPFLSPNISFNILFYSFIFFRGQMQCISCYWSCRPSAMGYPCVKMLLLYLFFFFLKQYLPVTSLLYTLAGVNSIYVHTKLYWLRPPWLSVMLVHPK